LEFPGIVADGPSHFRGFADGIEAGVVAGGELAKLFELGLDGGSGGHTRESTAAEHLLDGVEKLCGRRGR